MSINPNRRFPSVLLASGGLDSFVAYYYLDRPQTVYFHVGGRYSDKEERAVRELFPGIIVDHSLRLGEVEQEDAHVPYRNLFFAAASSARYSDKVYIAGVKDDAMTDKNEGVFCEFSQLLSKLERRPVEVASPFWRMTKTEVVRWYLDQGGSPDLLLKTVSCYSPDPINYCGRCASCFRKWAALWCVGLRLDFSSREILLDYRDRCLSGRYDPERNRTTLEAIEQYVSGSR